MRKLILAIFTLSVAGLLVMIATPSMAVHKNYNNQLVCGGCHTMHNSQGSTSGTDQDLGGPAGGAIVLLRGAVSTRSQVHNLCLQCHSSDGAQAGLAWDGHTAPKVNIANASGDGNGYTGLDSDVTNDDFGKIGAGGDFSAVMVASGSGWITTGPDVAVAVGRGHSLGLTTVTPPGASDGAISDFTCTSCHDPHGAYTSPTTEANRYRNLKLIPRGSGTTSITLNTNIRSYVGYGGCIADSNWTNGYTGGGNSLFVWPLYTGTPDWSTDTSACYDAGGRVNAYGVDEPGTNGISNWCATCHDQWHEEITTANSNGQDWNRHPVDNVLQEAGSLSSGGNVVIVDTTNYATARSQNRALPVADATGGAGVFYLKAGTETTNKVFCLSCHFAHGGPYFDNLRWNYLAAVDSGSQTANSISSITGCQLCHNR
ncbi:hypothetical protein MNBD_DELTA02-1168 [hydrothermal vent metagenome]|uniref:Doubled CXXCH motif domain-containing protein n=1 Tax=hydrothermal vent metagenome TaxID=652676 RepID=A0A3B0UX07_9ZZZZ